MITICYKVDLNEYGRSYASYNQGFIIAKFEGEKVVSLEGLFTRDYIEFQVCEEGVLLTYYKVSEDFCHLKEFSRIMIENGDFELPLRGQFYENGIRIQLITTDIYEEQEMIEKCENQMKEFKTTDLFKTINLFKRK